MAELIPLLVIALAFWFLLIRPQQKQRKRLQEIQRSLGVGDEVMTQAGMFGVVRGFDDRDRVLLQVAEGVTVTLARGAVVSLDQPEGAEQPDDTDESGSNRAEGPDAEGNGPARDA